jgi:MoaA/NifB/PqqE/SkfB family radical SAM enzyme
MSLPFLSIQIGKNDVRVFGIEVDAEQSTPLLDCANIVAYLTRVADGSHLLQAIIHMIRRDSSLTFNRLLDWVRSDKDAFVLCEIDEKGTGLSLRLEPSRDNLAESRRKREQTVIFLATWQHPTLRADVAASLCLSALDAAEGQLDEAFAKLYPLLGNPGWPIIHDAVAAIAVASKGEPVPTMLTRFVGGDTASIEQKRCLHPFGNPTVTSEGVVLLCNPHWQPSPIGRHEDGDDILNGRRACEIRESVTTGSFRFCLLSRCPHALGENLLQAVGIPPPIKLSKPTLPEFLSVISKENPDNNSINTTSVTDIELIRQKELKNLLNKKQVADHYYFVDVVGSCNLTCPSCAVGNMGLPRHKGLMSMPKFHAIIDRIVSDRSTMGFKKVFIDLYNWGEPMLHGRLPEMIQRIRKEDIGVGISSNLNVVADLQGVVKAIPTYIRISLSGFFNDTYRTTHRGGDVNAVKANMYLLRHLLDRHRNTETIVQVGYHMYRANHGADYDRMRDLCAELDFIFAPVAATLMPVEKTVRLIETGVEDQNDLHIINNLLISPNKRGSLLEGRRHNHIDCQYKKSRTTINYDGSVSLCCAVYEDDHIISKDFIETSHLDLTLSKYMDEFCGRCSKANMDLLYTGISTPEITAEIIANIGRNPFSE